MNIDIRQGDVLDVLRTMPSESVHCVITSPPYFGLRDYGIPGQLGLEDTPDAYLQRMVEVFREVRRVLRSDGTCWVNMGDSYATGTTTGRSGSTNSDVGYWQGVACAEGKRVSDPALKPKDLMMMPARLALALQADGWWLRSDIIWCKRAPMPESVTDRPTSAHEHIFLLAKAARYFYDADAVRENVGQTTRIASKMRSSNYLNNNAFENSSDVGGWNGQYSETTSEAGRNLWNYWLLSPEPYPDAHFATFPTEIPRRCIKAGTSEWGYCGECGAPYRRVVERTPMVIARSDRQEQMGEYGRTQASGTMVSPDDSKTTGWAPTCAHTSAPVVPATVLDIFNGSGTTGLVALELGRNYIGIELNPQYVELTRKRLMQEMPLFAYQALEGAA